MNILKRLERSHIDGNWKTKPTTRTYNMVIKACSSSNRGSRTEQRDALNIAISTYKRLRASSYGDCDKFTFISMLKAVGKLLPLHSQLRQQIAVELFHTCCEEGLLDNCILENFMLTASEKESQSIFASYTNYRGRNVDKIFRDLPKAWSCKSE